MLIGVDFQNYNVFHAFMSGIVCTWAAVIGFAVIMIIDYLNNYKNDQLDDVIFIIIIILNISMPIIVSFLK